MQSFVVMIDYGRPAARPLSIRSRGARASPASRRVNTGNISFIREIADGSVEDITAEIHSDAALPDIGLSGAELQSCRFDHIRDLRKHEKA